MRLYKNFCETAFDENGVLSEFRLKYKENYNFGYDVVDEMARIAPDQKAMIWRNKDEERTFTYKDMSELSNKAANLFTSYGIKKGDKVLIILKRHYEYWYVVTALHKIGAVIIPATHMLTVEDMVYRINSVDIKAAVVTPDAATADRLIRAQEKTSSLESIFVVRNPRKGTVDFTKEMDKMPDSFERRDTKASEPMLIYFTSGTTGYPKAVSHDHTYSLSHIVTAKYWQNVKENGLHLTISETGWGKASWGKLYGQWLCGCCVMTFDLDSFTPVDILRRIEEYKVTSFCAPPTVYRYFVEAGMDKYNLYSLEYITTAGEALNPEVWNKVKEQTGLSLMEGFGQTESVLMLANLTGSNPKPGSMGTPTPIYNTALIDIEGNEVPDGLPGELVVIPKENQHGIFMGYADDPALYEKVWRGGVYHTGDTAYKDEDGYYWYVGRIDDLIKTKGYRVGPFEIENVLMEHPAVTEVAVTGVPDPKRGQAIKATIVLAPGYEETKELTRDIKKFSNQRLASYKWVQIFEFVNEMPKTISGKIRRVEIRDQK